MKNNNKRSLQFSFEITLDFLEADYTSAFNFKLCLKRGNKQFETKNTMKYEVGMRRNVQISEVFNLNANLYFKDDTNSELEDKIYKIYLQVYTKTGFKNATFAELNLSKLVNLDSNGQAIIVSEKFSNINKKDILDLDFAKHPFNFLKLKMSFISKYVEAVNFNEMSAEAEDRDLKSKLLNETNNLQVKEEVKVSSVSIQNDEDKKRPIETVQDEIKNSYYNTGSQDEEIFLLNQQIRVLNEKIETLEKEKLTLTDQLKKNNQLIVPANNIESNKETKNEKRVR
jgi:hypothetical protein